MISLVTQADGTARRIPFVSVGLVLLMGLAFASIQTRTQQARADAAQAMAEAVSYFEENPFVALPDRMEPALAAERARELRAAFDAERRGLGLHLELPASIVRRAQERFDALVQTAFARQARLPANEHGFRGRDDSPGRWVEHVLYHPTLAGLAVSAAFVLLLGIALEDAWGSVVFAIFCAAMVPLGALAFATLHVDMPAPWLGASGLVAAMLGASTRR